MSLTNGICVDYCMKKAILFMICFILTLSLTGCITANSVTWNGKQEELVELLMADDISDMRKYAGLVDYDFVGKVEKIIDDVLPDKVKEREDYFSTYKIHVIKNVKGQLIDEVEVLKMGDFKKDGTMCIVTAELPNGEWIRNSGLPENKTVYFYGICLA